MLYKKNIKLSFLLAITLFSFSGLAATADDFSKSNPLSEMYHTQREQKPFPLPEVKKEKSGPFIASNTGYGFLFNKSKYVLASPVYEGIVGYHVGNSYKIAFSYQYQHTPLDVQFQGRAVIAGRSHPYEYMVNSGLNLQTAALKLYTSPPHPYRWKIFTFSPYLSFGTGLGWADVKGVFQARRSIFLGEVGFCAGMSAVSATAGCKYSNWSFDNNIYSVTPYVGLQISF